MPLSTRTLKSPDKVWRVFSSTLPDIHLPNLQPRSTIDFIGRPFPARTTPRLLPSYALLHAPSWRTEQATLSPAGSRAHTRALVLQLRPGRFFFFFCGARVRGRPLVSEHLSALGTNNAINIPLSPFPYYLLGDNSLAPPYLDEASLFHNSQHYPITAPPNYNSYGQAYPAAGGYPDYPAEGNGFPANDFLLARLAPWTGSTSDVGMMPTPNFAPLPLTGAYAPMQALTGGPSAPAFAVAPSFIDNALPIAGPGMAASARPTYSIYADPSAPAFAGAGAVAPSFIDGALPVVGTGVAARAPAPAPARPTCSICGKSFSRQADLERHAKKHRADATVHHCPHAGCAYSYHRKDKVDEHARRLHRGRRVRRG